MPHPAGRQDFEPIASAQHAPLGTVADLKMRNGRVYRAVWCERGRCTAWWPLAGNRKRPIGLYDPVAWKRVDGIEGLPSTRR